MIVVAVAVFSATGKREFSGKLRVVQGGHVVVQTAHCRNVFFNPSFVIRKQTPLVWKVAVY